MRKLMLALALTLACQLGANENAWFQDFYRVLGAEHAILNQVYVHPNKKIVLCLVYPSEHYVGYKVRLNETQDKVKGYVHMKFKEARKFFPWLKMHKKAYLEPLKRPKTSKPKVPYGSPTDNGDVLQFNPDTIV